MDGRKDSAHAKKHCSDGKESRIGLTGPRPLRALPIVRPDVLARRRQRQREFTSKLADQEENSISANSPKLICTDSDDYSMEAPSKILCGNPYGGIKKVEVPLPRGLFKTTMSPTQPMSSEALVDKLAIKRAVQKSRQGSEEYRCGCTEPLHGSPSSNNASESIW
jgi:hypothetical protein